MSRDRDKGEKVGGREERKEREKETDRQKQRQKQSQRQTERLRQTETKTDRNRDKRVPHPSKYTPDPGSHRVLCPGCPVCLR